MSGWVSVDRTLAVPVIMLILVRVPEMEWIIGRSQGLGFGVRVVFRDWVLARWVSVPSSPTGVPLVPLSPTPRGVSCPLSPWSGIVPIGAIRLGALGRMAVIVSLPSGECLGV